jgi:hypothetical protein
MRNIQHLIIFLFCIGVSAQNLKVINYELKIPDSLTFDREIRIYRGFGITNLTEVFRMYQDNSDSWKIENYKYYQVVGEMEKSNIEKTQPKTKNDPELIWLKLLSTNVIDIPNMTNIEYKMEKRGEIKLVDGEYEIVSEKLSIMDGIGYLVKIKNFDKNNEIYYGNPEIYLKHYPEIDELNYFSELLNILRTELMIWKK